MTRVKFIYTLRRFGAVVAMRPTLLAIFLAALWFNVSLIDVARNAIALGQPVTLYHFGVAAFMQAELMVKVLAVGFGLVSVWLVLDLARNFNFSRYIKVPRFLPLFYR